MAFSDKDIFELIKQNQLEKDWIKEAREINKELNALKYGKNYHELLVRIEKVENSDRAIARKNYSYDIRDMFERVMQPRQNVFSADGGSTWWKEGLNNARKENIKEALQDFRGRKSLKKFLSDSLFQISDVDPNGLIFIEYTSENGKLNDLYPTYKSIQDIADYEPNGIKLDWVLFAPVTKIDENKQDYKEWRFVDETRDVLIKERKDILVIIDESVNDFGEVPAVILSNIEKFGSKLRLSWLFFITQLAKKYARDTSVKTIYEFLQGFPKHWRYAQICNTCKGTGKKDGKNCPSCNGKGEIGRSDVTDDIRLPLPVDRDDALVAPNVGGWTSPDLETLQWMEENRSGLEAMIDKTMWGTHKEADQSGNETATGRFIDIQPVQNKLNVFADYTEQVHNILASYVITLVDPVGTDTVYHEDYGRRFIIESPDVLTKQYLDAKEQGAPSTILDRILNEVIMSKYKNDPVMRNIMTKKATVEPYVHIGVDTVNNIYGSREAKRKDVFPEWWRTEADKNKQEQGLREDFNNWFNLNYPENEQNDGEGESV